MSENHHSKIHNILQYGRFKQEELELRYLKKLKFFLKSSEISLIFDDTLDYRIGKKIEGAQFHKDHCSNGYAYGHQYFTSMLITGNFQFPLFPRLYEKDSITKIEMAIELIAKISNKIKIANVMCDSWYSDVKIMKLCRERKIRLLCGIKTNRKIKFNSRGSYTHLSEYSRDVIPNKNYNIDDNTYRINSHEVSLHKFPNVKMLISQEYNNDKWSDNFHLISTISSDTAVKIIRLYSRRWYIETFHRDIKQNLGFSSCQMRKKTGIVRHAILVTLTYAILKIFMFQNKLSMTIGECIEYITNTEMNEFVREIVEIEDKNERIMEFTRLFIRKTAKV